MSRKKVYDNLPIARGFGTDCYFNRLVTCFKCKTSLRDCDSTKVYMRKFSFPPEILCQSCFDKTDGTAVDIAKAKPFVIVDE